MYGKARHRHMTTTLIGLAAFAALGVGCGRNRVTVDVDVDSFMDPDDLTAEYQVPPFVPPVELDLEPVAVNLVEGFEDFGAAEEVQLAIAVRYDNTSGRGNARLTLFFAADAQSVFGTPEVVTFAADLRPSEVTESGATFAADARVLELFTQKQMYMGVRFNWTPEAGSTDALTGGYVITSISAKIISTIQIL